MDGVAFLDRDNEQPIFGINYMDWPELTYMKNTKSAYYLKNDDDYSDLLEDQEIYMFDK